jgi:hypothetical protein
MFHHLMLAGMTMNFDPVALFGWSHAAAKSHDLMLVYSITSVSKTSIDVADTN